MNERMIVLVVAHCPPFTLTLSSLLSPVPLQSCLPFVTVVIITANVLSPLLHTV